ncbi:hypothetical protein SUGI_0905790 [Cryptomeria japonica]|uniref:short-chain dehydrogenase ptmH-like n=1 Tax=Cryptomeria japonica TaxID=3369 RepID=UPI0024148FBC|nr:short-chain dehydrogenase ptmH-like [Cryptomeria japonica]GLJ43547.1 hypothetical protein SUGI_0905790 [Cryptomeria japonica]
MTEKEEEASNRPVVLVTGCGKGGIGFEYCKHFAQMGCDVYASDVGSVENMQELTAQNARIKTLCMDVTSDESVAAGVEEVVREAGRIDVVVNNAGVGATGPLAELPLAEVQRAWEINCLGHLRVVQTVVPHMVRRGHGTIVNVGSVVGAVSTPWAGAYCASKAALHAASEALRLELRPFGIRVVLVMPGAIRSNFGEANLQRLRERKWGLYAPFKEAILGRAVASQGANSTCPSAFASHIVAKVLMPRPPRRIVFGRMAGLLGILSVAPLWLRDLYFSRRFGL